MVKKKYKIKKRTIGILLIFIFVFLNIKINQIYAQPVFPKLSFGVGTSANPQDLDSSVNLLLIFTALSLLPSMLIMMTSFTRIIVILSFLKQAIGAQQSIPAQVVVGLALFLTLFIMSPVINDSYSQGIKPYMDQSISQHEAIEKTMAPVRKFMFKQTRESDLKLFLELSKDENLKKNNVTLDNIPNAVLIPSFVISELKTAFQVGFLLFLPFIVIDMVVSSTLMSMGMMMLPPMMISMPFKILLFVLVDGWDLVIRSIVLGFK